MTKINPKFTRIYLNGYEISGSASDIGTAGVTLEAPMGAAYSDEVMNTVLGNASILCGPINAFLTPAASPAIGIHELLKSGVVVSSILIARGVAGVPAVGDPMFAWTMQQGTYTVQGEGVIGVNIAFPNASYAAVKGYCSPFGLIAHAKSAETAVNSGLAELDAGAATTKGGIFVYQLLSSDGTVTLSLDEAAANTTDGDFAALSGATSGSINASTTPVAGMVALALTATVKRYLRWQLVLGSATTATFVLGFIRGT